MDAQISEFLNGFVDKTLQGPGFIAYAPKEKDEFRIRLIEYFADLIFDTLLRNLTDEQMGELQAMPDMNSEEAQQKIAMMSASIPGFIFMLEDRFGKTAEEIGRNGKVPEIETADPSAGVSNPM